VESRLGAMTKRSQGLDLATTPSEESTPFRIFQRRASGDTGWQIRHVGGPVVRGLLKDNRGARHLRGAQGWSQCSVSTDVGNDGGFRLFERAASRRPRSICIRSRTFTRPLYRASARAVVGRVFTQGESALHATKRITGNDRSRATGSSVIFRSAQNIRKSSIREEWPKFTGQNVSTESLARDLRHYRRITLFPWRRYHQRALAVGSRFPHRHRINVEGHAQVRVPRPQATSSNRLQYEKRRADRNANQCRIDKTRGVPGGILSRRDCFAASRRISP